MIHLSEPFSPSDHVGPESIIKEEVRICVSPPPVMSSNLVFSHLLDPIEGVLGDLKRQSLSAFFQIGTKREITSKVEG